MTPAPPVLRVATSGIFAVSGAAALAFEALLFRRAGLTFGNSVWAVSLVLCSFMIGLAAGNGLAAGPGQRIRRPFLAYAALEAAIGLLGLLLVLLLPGLTPVLAPWFRSFLDQPLLLNAARLGAGVCLLTLPAVAMGMTLPVLVAALARQDRNYGSVLGRLYGWNTLGAVVGVLIAERVLVAQLGVRGAAAAATALNLLAAGGALWLHHTYVPDAAPSRSTTPIAPDKGSPRRRARLLAAAFVCGALLLCLEVLWFRFFQLFSMPHGWNLAVMLAVVLLGIGCGGLLASYWFRHHPDAEGALAEIALGTGALVGLLYLALPAGMARPADQPLEPLYVWLMFPVSLGSGLLFPLLGRALQKEGVAEVPATGQLTLANTLGSAAGSLLGGFVCLPLLGLDRSFFVICMAYGVVALLVRPARRRAGRSPVTGRRPLLRLAPLLAFLLALALFPFDAMARCLVRSPRSVYAALAPHGMRLEALREGSIETVQLFRKDLGEHAWVHQLATNGYSMSSTGLKAQRYMKLYVHWPVAVHPAIKDACLISFGVGSTARALADTRSIERIDVVDISRDILDVSHLIEPDAAQHPLNDPRVQVHIEDGRFFLEVSDRQYDLITSEPPPPRNAGIVNLYSREYFELIRRRLRDGGIVTYWLPIDQMRAHEAKSIVRAFRDAFPDASLWTGAGLEWMLVGVKNPRGPVSAEQFGRQWRDPEVAPGLAELGLQVPEQLGALFIADGERLGAWLGDALPLTDDHPERLAAHDVAVPEPDLRAYAEFMNSPAAGRNFLQSTALSRLWPADLREATGEWFALQRTVNSILMFDPLRYRELHAALEDPRLSVPLLWVFDSDEKAQRLVRQISPQLLRQGSVDPDVYRHLAAAAAQRGEFITAAALLSQAEARSRQAGAVVAERDYYFRIYLLARSGQRAPAGELARELHRAVQRDPVQVRRVEEFWRWLQTIEPALPGGPLRSSPGSGGTAPEAVGAVGLTPPRTDH